MKLFEKVKINTGINKEREIRFLNVPIAQWGKKQENGVKEKYFKIIPKSFEHRALDKILKNIPQNHDHIWILRTYGLGEALLLNYIMKELLIKYNVKNPCIVGDREIVKDLFDMFTDIPFYTLDIPHESFAPYFTNRNIMYNGKFFHIYHCTLRDAEEFIQKHLSGECTNHYMTAIKEWSGVDNFEILYPKFTDEIKQSALDKVKKVNLDINNFVFLVVEANGDKSFCTDFFTDISEEFIKKDYDVFVNKADGCTGYGKSVYLTISEAAYIASLSKVVVGLRCGFMELIVSEKERKNTIHVLYSRNHMINGKLFQKTYTLLKYPFINLENIYEYVITQENTNDILTEILNTIHTKGENK